MFGLIWLASLVLAATVIIALLWSYDEEARAYPDGLPDLGQAKVVIVGSSLARFALPSRVPEAGVLGDGRSCALLSLPGISGPMTTRLLAHAIDSGADTVLVEINAFAQESAPLHEPVLLDPLVRGVREAGRRMSVAARALVGHGQRARDRLDCGAPRLAGRYLDVERLALREFYRLVPTEPSEPDELQAVLDRARERGVDVAFFAPPRPDSAVSAMGSTAYTTLQAHLAGTAARFGVPLWSPARSWPDAMFMDLQGHAAPAGRDRFRDELARWYTDRP